MNFDGLYKIKNMKKKNLLIIVFNQNKNGKSTNEK